MKVVIMCGIPGSGKSTFVKEHYPDATVYSADLFFSSPCPTCLGRVGLCSTCGGEGTAYKFDSSKLWQAHGWCLRTFSTDVRDISNILSPESHVMVVDNTNCTVAEVAPYAALALAHAHDLEIITLRCPPEIAANRNKHGVSLEALKGMADRLEKREMAPWWPHKVIEQE